VFDELVYILNGPECSATIFACSEVEDEEDENKVGVEGEKRCF